jgi:hypothetical protein
MKNSEFIEDKINKLPKRYVFTYLDFMNEVTRREAIIKHLNRMAASGKINKLLRVSTSSRKKLYLVLCCPTSTKL